MTVTTPAAGSRRCDDADATRALGAELGALVQAGDVVVLNGPLGAGKTTFTQGFAQGMNVTGRVTSPTFTIARVHRPAGNGPCLIHVDAYRLLGENPGEDADPVGALDSLDLDTELEDAVVVAEWGANLFEQLGARCLSIVFDRHTALEEDPDSEARYISWSWQLNDQPLL